jgi:hypothetical protein
MHFQLSKRVEVRLALVATMYNTMLSHVRLGGHRITVHGS